MFRYEKAEKTKHEAKRKAALEKLEKGENAKLDEEEDDDDDKIAETEEAGESYKGHQAWHHKAQTSNTFIYAWQCLL